MKARNLLFAAPLLLLAPTASAQTYPTPPLLLQTTGNDAPTASEPKPWHWLFAQEEALPDSISSSNVWSDPAIRFELHDADNTVASGTRAELRWRAEPLVKCERWYGFKVFLPAEYVSDPAPENIAQWHDTPDPAKADNPATPQIDPLPADRQGRSPSMSLEVKNGRWYLWVMWAAGVRNNYADDTDTYDLGNYQKGNWTKWVFHVKSTWEDNGTGLIEVWRNGTKVLTRVGPNSYNDEVGKYFKLGIYKWLWNLDVLPENRISTTTQRILFIDNIRIGNENATYSHVAP